MTLFSRATSTQTKLKANLASLLPTDTWFFRQDDREVRGLTHDGLAALVRLGYVNPDALVGSSDSESKALSEYPALIAAQTSPFAALPALAKPAVPTEPPPVTFDNPPSLVGRFASLMIDLTVIGVLSTVSSFFSVPLLTGFSFLSAVVLTWFICSSLYFGLSESNAHGASLGKRLIRLQVVSENKKPIGLVRGLWRGALKSLSVIVLPIAGVIALSSKDKRALHDRLARTRVVRKS